VEHEAVGGADLGVGVHACVRDRLHDPHLVAIEQGNPWRVDVARVYLPNQNSRPIALVKRLVLDEDLAEIDRFVGSLPSGGVTLTFLTSPTGSKAT